MSSHELAQRADIKSKVANCFNDTLYSERVTSKVCSVGYDLAVWCDM